MLRYLFYALVCLSVLTGQLSAKVNKKPFVTCHFRGQLGNQLHQIATTLAHAWDNNLEPIFPELKRNDLNIPINRKRIFFRLNASPLPRPIQDTFKQLHHFEKIEIPCKPDHMLNGHFQTWEYYDHHRQKILDLFAPRDQELNQLKSKYAELLNHPLTVGVHVRTFNKKWSKHIPFVGLAYYEKALSHFPPEALFVIFSDRINWCKHHFKKFNRPMIFIEKQDHIQDLFLMSMLKHNIIGNSSFSWWAAYLNKNPNKMVIAPSHFIRPTNTFKVVNANMPDWSVIDIDYDHSVVPYPHDMYDYDGHSTSVDVDKAPLMTRNNETTESKKTSRLKNFIILTGRRGSGMFSIFDDVFDSIKRYEFGQFYGLEVDFDTGGLYYEPKYGPNWWSYYCEPLSIGQKINVKKTPGKPRYILFRHKEAIHRKEIFKLIQKYFVLKPHIQNKIDTFEKENLKDFFVLSVHYRGTDKVSEAPFVPYEKVPEEILNVMKTHGKMKYKIFLATDEQAFLDYMINVFGDLVCYNKDALRSTNGGSVHFNKNFSRYKCGEDALIDCILLSKGNFLIRSSSNLSRWSTYFNPDIPVVKLNTQYDGRFKTYAPDPALTSQLKTSINTYVLR